MPPTCAPSAGREATFGRAREYTLADHFFRTMPGALEKGLVHVLDAAGEVGDDHAVRTLRHRQRTAGAQVNELRQLFSD